MDIKINLTDTLIKTQYLTMRAWQETDIDDLFEITSCGDVVKMLGMKKHSAKSETQQLLQKYMVQKNALAIVHNDDDKVIGNIGLHISQLNEKEPYSHLKLKELVYYLSKDYWGKGIMTQAVKAVIDYSLQELPLNGLSCGHFEINSASRHIIEKCGFKYVGKGDYYAKEQDKTYVNLNYLLLK